MAAPGGAEDGLSRFIRSDSMERSGGGKMNYDEMSDEDLIQAYYGCDDQAFEKLHKKYRRRIFAFHLRFVSRYEDAEDLTELI